jgi:hypothetical protein
MKNILIIILSILISSCGARKVNIDKLSIKKDSTSITNIAVVTDIKKISIDTTNIKTQIETDEITLTPIDTCKEMVVDGKKYKNVVIRHKKSKDNSLYTNSKKESETQRKDSVVSVNVVKKETTDGRSKNIDKKESIVGNIIVYSLLLLFWIIVILFIRKTYKEYVA